MSDETIRLREYVDAMLAAHREIHEREARAVSVANTALSARLDGMNEIRDQLNQQARTFATKTELDAVDERSRTHITRGELMGVLGAIVGIGSLGLMLFRALS